jgi:type VI secretion system protein ImpA
MDVLATAAPAFPFGIDSLGELARLLAPVDPAQPTGHNLRLDISSTSPYHRLREIRSTARNNERAALANGDSDFIRASDWQPLLVDIPALLADHSKDLELSAWLIEALTRCHGLRGVAAGFSLAAALIEQYGSQLFPQPDDDGVAAQLAALTGLNGFGSEGALIAPLKSIVITEGSPPAPFSTWQCEQAFETERIGDAARRDARGRRGFVLRSDLDRAIGETSPRFFQQLASELDAAVIAFSRYQEAIDRHCAESPQPTARLRDTLEQIGQTLRHIAGDKLQVPTAPTISADEAQASVSTSVPVIARQLGDRHAALDQLREVAAFFRRTEPHSPISYAVEQAVHWSNLSLPELIGELIPDDSARDKFRTLTGIRATEK